MTLKDLENIPMLPAQFGPVRQVAFIVDDIEEAISEWKSMGVKPFLVARNISPLQNAYYRNEKSGEVPINVAFAYHGNMQIELIEPLHSSPSIYSEAVEGGITDVHHYAVCVENFRKSYDYALDHGYEAVVDSGIDGLARMSYVEHEDRGIILEIIEWNVLTRPYFDAIRTMWEDAKNKGENTEFNLSGITPKGPLILMLIKYLVKKMTGQIKTTRRIN